MDSGTYQVCRGCGMGLLHSGDLVDLIYYHRVEKWLCRPFLKAKYGVANYIRFRDDVMIVMAPDKAPQLLSQIAVFSGYFRIKLEADVPDGAPFLNLELFKVADGKRIAVKYYFKPTSLGLPLSALRGQAPTVHRTWPQAMVKTIRELSTYPTDAATSIAILRDRFSTAMVPLIWPKDSDRRCVRAAAPSQHILWLPMVYHPALAKTLDVALGRFLEIEGCLFHRCFGPNGFLAAGTIRFAWKNGVPPFAMVVRRLYNDNDIV